MKLSQYAFTVVALALVVSGLAYAQTGWREPSANPPDCVAGDLGCYQPINVSSADQIKGVRGVGGGLGLEGGLMVTGYSSFGGGTTIWNRLVINRDADATQNGYVLTAQKDGSGNVDAMWKPAGAAGALTWRKGENCGGMGSYWSSTNRGVPVKVQCCADGNCAYPLERTSGGGIKDNCPSVNSGFVGVGDVGDSGAYFATCVCNQTSCGTKN